MAEQPEVRPGQIWEQRSGDLRGRWLKVIETDHFSSGFTKVELVRNSADVQEALDGNPKAEWKRWGYQPNDLRGRKTTMRTTSLRPPRFRLVEDRRAEAASG
jgi:hypothetical protein